MRCDKVTQTHAHISTHLCTCLQWGIHCCCATIQDPSPTAPQRTSMPPPPPPTHTNDAVDTDSDEEACSDTVLPPAPMLNRQLSSATNEVFDLFTDVSAVKHDDALVLLKALSEAKREGRLSAEDAQLVYRSVLRLQR